MTERAIIILIILATIVGILLIVTIRDIFKLKYEMLTSEMVRDAVKLAKGTLEVEYHEDD